MLSRSKAHPQWRPLPPSSAEARRNVASEKHFPQRGTLPFIGPIRPIRPIPPSRAGLAASPGALRASESSLMRAQILALPRGAEGRGQIRQIRQIRPIPPGYRAGLAASLGALRASEGSLRRAQILALPRDAKSSVFQQGNAGREERQEGFHFSYLEGRAFFRF